MTADQLEQEVLKLPAEQRADIAERIIASLDGVAGIERDWLKELKRRGHELEAAAAAAVPTEAGPTSAQQQPRLVSFYMRPEALDEFIAAWKAERAGEGIPPKNQTKTRP